MPVLPRHIDAIFASTAVSHALRCRMLPIALKVNVKPRGGTIRGSAYDNVTTHRLRLRSRRIGGLA
jgi:hypothetical protein